LKRLESVAASNQTHITRPVATVLVLQGTLTQSSTLICGTTWARVRQMTDSTGKSIQSATAGTPVTVCGWKDLPSAGDEVLSGEENDVKKAVENRKRKMELDELKVDVESINEKRKEVREREGEAEGGEGRKGDEESVKELRVIVKADVSGSVEAVVGAIEGIGNKIAKVKIVQTGVGDITDSDVDMAKAVDGGVSLSW
jgi:translation initiation factor IF-2